MSSPLPALSAARGLAVLVALATVSMVTAGLLLSLLVDMLVQTLLKWSKNKMMKNDQRLSFTSLHLSLGIQCNVEGDSKPRQLPTSRNSTYRSQADVRVV